MYPDRILLNGNIITLDATRPRVSALALAGERIVAVGADAEIAALAGPRTARNDLGGRTVWPGLTDAHIHWEGVARALQDVDLHDVPSKAEAVRRVAERAHRTPPGEWIVGRGWAQDLWDERAFPTAADLDAVTPQHPVYLSARSGHAAWVNSRALALAHITASTPDPVGGQIVRDAHGRPTGILLEDAAMLMVWQHVPAPTPERLADWMREAQEHAWRAGLTGLHDFDDPSCLVALQILREQGKLGLRVVKQINAPWAEHAHALGLRFGFGDAWLRLGAVKLFADGALGPRTAAMIAPYAGEPHNYGIVVTDKEEMYAISSRASAQGLPASVHAIGDRAVHDVLDVYEAVRREEAARGVPRAARRHRIEHVQLLHPDDVGRLAALDVIASMQPIHATADWEMAERYWGERSRWAYNWRAQLEVGAVLAFGSDAPVEPFAPLLGLYAAVTRQREDGSPRGGWRTEACVSLDEALRAYTQGAAYAAGLERELGTLAAGKLADLIVLDRDLHNAPPAALLEARVLGTMVGGVWRWRAFE